MADEKGDRERVKALVWDGKDLRQEGFFIPTAENCVDEMRLRFVPGPGIRIVLVDEDESAGDFFWDDKETDEPCGGPYNLTGTCPPQDC